MNFDASKFEQWRRGFKRQGYAEYFWIDENYHLIPNVFTDHIDMYGFREYDHGGHRWRVWARVWEFHDVPSVQDVQNAFVIIRLGGSQNGAKTA